jgi:hypothetical protein
MQTKLMRVSEAPKGFQKDHNFYLKPVFLGKIIDQIDQVLRKIPGRKKNLDDLLASIPGTRNDAFEIIDWLVLAFTGSEINSKERYEKVERQVDRIEKAYDNCAERTWCAWLIENDDENVKDETGHVLRYNGSSLANKFVECQLFSVTDWELVDLSGELLLSEDERSKLRQHDGETLTICDKLLTYSRVWDARYFTAAHVKACLYVIRHKAHGAQNVNVATYQLAALRKNDYSRSVMRSIPYARDL